MDQKTRILSKPIVYYEDAMHNALELGLANQSFTQDDYTLHLLWCRYIHFNPQNKIPPNTKRHSHSFFEIHCIVSGNFEYCENGKEVILLGAGDFILIAPHIEHNLVPLDIESETFALAFVLKCNDTPEGNKLSYQFESINIITASVTPTMLQLIELIMEEFYSASYFCVQNIKSYITVFIIHIVRLFFVQPSQKQLYELKTETRLADIEKYITDNSNLIFSVVDIAKYLHLSPRQLANIIKEEFHISAKSFIDNIKIQQAKKLLIETDMSLQLISEALGFSEPNNFNRFFKRVEGMPPGIFRLSKGFKE